ncbi:MAG: SPOR domain-containing protein [Chitinophagales bacterium]
MRIFLIIILAVCTFSVQAQNTISVSDKSTIETSMDIDYMLEKHIEKNAETDEADGYRIQIMYSSNREEVYSKKSEVYSNFRQYKAYMVYDQPYYKLRIGDFETKVEARKFLEDVIAEYPTAFIVEDRIKL